MDDENRLPGYLREKREDEAPSVSITSGPMLSDAELVIQEQEEHVAYVASFRDEGYSPSIGNWAVDLESGLVGRAVSFRPGVASDRPGMWRLACSENGRFADETVSLWRGADELVPVDAGMAFHLVSVAITLRDRGPLDPGVVAVRPFLVVARDTASAIPPAIFHARRSVSIEWIECNVSEVDAKAVPEAFGRIVSLAA